MAPPPSFTPHIQWQHCYLYARLAVAVIVVAAASRWESYFRGVGGFGGPALPSQGVVIVLCMRAVC